MSCVSYVSILESSVLPTSSTRPTQNQSPVKSCSWLRLPTSSAVGRRWERACTGTASPALKQHNRCLTQSCQETEGRRKYDTREAHIFLSTRAPSVALTSRTTQSNSLSRSNGASPFPNVSLCVHQRASFYGMRSTSQSSLILIMKVRAPKNRT